MPLPPQVVHKRIVTKASIEDAWAMLADSDRFNRVLGSGAIVEHVEQPDGSYLTIGEIRTAGLVMRWHDQPREFVSPYWMRTAREFVSGPLAGLYITLSFEEVAAGTEVSLSAEIVPRNAWMWPIAAIVALRFRNGVDRALDAARDELDGRGRHYEPRVEPLTNEAELLLAMRLEEVSPAVAKPLAHLIRDTPAYRQARLSPLLLARMWNLDEDVVIEGFLDAARAGVVELSWELLCPNCRGGERVPLLPTGAIAVHCPSCNIRYDGGFLDACAITFAPAPEIRDTRGPAACLMAPTRTPHVLARERIDPGGKLDFELELKPGGYRIESDGLYGAATLEVVEGGPEDDLVFDLTAYGVLPPRLRVAPGKRKLRVRSQRGTTEGVHIQSRTFEPTILTAARFLSRPGARSLLPESAILPEVEVESRRAAVIVLELLRGLDRDALERALSATDPDRLQMGDRRVIGLWGNPERALTALKAVRKFPAVSGALAIGTALEIGKDGVGGPAVAHATDAARMAGAGRLLLTESVTDATECGSMLAAIELEPYGAYHALPPAVAEVETTNDPETDEVFGEYVLGPPLGRGGFGNVYEGTHRETGAAVAIKVLREEWSVQPDYVEPFYEECQLTSRIDHPGVVRVRDWGFNERGRLYLVMDRLYGPMFSEEIEDRGGVTPHRAAAVAAALLDILDRAHDLGIVHCDVKSNNVLIAHERETAAEPFLGAGERVVLLDFGVSSPIRQRFPTVKTMGTIAFMAPEQDSGGEVDARSDLYSVGVILVHAVCGEVPEDLDSALQRFPTWLADVTRKALESDPDHRWPSAHAMREALIKALDEAEDAA